MHLKKQLLLGLTGFALVTLPASAAYIAEVEANDTLATAQNVNGGFGLGANVDIGSHLGIDPATTPNVSIRASGDGTLDYYAFNVPITGTVSLDLDYGQPGFDAVIGLWRVLGGGLFDYLAYRDDRHGEFDAATALVSFIGDSPDPGSVDSPFLDPSLRILNLAAGNYVVGVKQFNFDDEDDTGFLGTNGPSQAYTLHITRPAAGSVPDVGSTLALLGLGVTALAGLRRKQV